MFPIAYICIVKTPGKNINASDSGISNDLGGPCDLHKSEAFIY